jgi:hypothetical protein
VKVCAAGGATLVVAMDIVIGTAMLGIRGQALAVGGVLSCLYRGAQV